MSLLQQTVAKIQPQSQQARKEAKAHLDDLTMPHWAMGRLLDLAVEIAGMTDSQHPSVERRTLVVCAGDHGVAAEGVSKYPQEVTLQQIANFIGGGGGCNAMARVGRAEVFVANLGVAGEIDASAKAHVLDYSVARGTANIAQGPAMTREQAIASLENGIRIAQSLADRTDLFAIGEMGIANTTPSSCIFSLLCDVPAEEITGPGSGVDEPTRLKKIEVVKRALAINQPDRNDGVDILAKVGGFEIGGMAGVILGAAAMRKPVLVDGFITTAAALIAQAICPAAADYMIASHHSMERGHITAVRRLGKEPLLNLNLRLGEGTGACVAMPLVEAAVRLLTEVATFESAGVSRA